MNKTDQNLRLCAFERGAGVGECSARHVTGKRRGERGVAYEEKIVDRLSVLGVKGSVCRAFSRGPIVCLPVGRGGEKVTSLKRTGLKGHVQQSAALCCSRNLLDLAKDIASGH